MKTLAEQGRGRIGPCAECGAHVRVLTAFDAAVLVDVSSYTIYRWAEAGAIHYSTTPEGVLMVCSRSLPRRREQRDTTSAPRRAAFTEKEPE